MNGAKGNTGENYVKKKIEEEQLRQTPPHHHHLHHHRSTGGALHRTLWLNHTTDSPHILI